MTHNREADVDYELAAFVAELRRLADALESGSGYAIEIDGETVTLPTDALMSVSHEIEDGEAELEFQLTWSTGKTAGDQDEETAEGADSGESEETRPAGV